MQVADPCHAGRRTATVHWSGSMTRRAEAVRGAGREPSPPGRAADAPQQLGGRPRANRATAPPSWRNSSDVHGIRQGAAESHDPPRGRRRSVRVHLSAGARRHSGRVSGSAGLFYASLAHTIRPAASWPSLPGPAATRTARRIHDRATNQTVRCSGRQARPAPAQAGCSSRRSSKWPQRPLVFNSANPCRTA